MKVIFAPMFFLMLAACGPEGQELRKLQAQIAEQQREIDALREEMKNARSDILVQGAQLSKLSSLPPEMGLIDVASKGYSLVRNAHGVFPVSSKQVTPYLDGFKIVISVGNPTLFTFSGVNLKADWSVGCYRKADGGFEKCSKLVKDFSLTNELKPGVYTDLEIIIPGVAASDLEGLSVSLTFDQIRLMN